MPIAPPPSCVEPRRHKVRIAHLRDTTVSPKWAVEEVIEEDHSKMGWPLLGEALLTAKGSDFRIGN